METEALFLKIEKIKMPIRIAIIAGTLVLLVGLFVWFIYLPKTEEISRTREQIAGLQQKLAQAKVRTKNLAKFEEEFKQVNVQFQEALKLLPDKKEIPSLLTGITQLGKDSNLEFRTFRPQDERKKEFYIEIPVSITVGGAYHNVATFFDKVGKMDRIVNILDVSMKPETAMSTNLVTNCTAITFRFEAIAEPEKKTPKKQ